MANRNVNLSTVCLLDGEEYQTREHALEALADACEGAKRDLVVLPHMPFLSFDGERPMAGLEPFAAMARRHGTYVALALREEAGGREHATAVILDREGKLVHKYRKTHAFPDDDGLALGDELQPFEADFGAIGCTVTTDFYFPEVYETLWMKGAEVLLWHHFPERFRDHSGWEPLLTARARDQHSHFVAAMYADPRTYITNRYEMGMQGAAFGRSMIVNRAGVPVADTGHYHGAASATVDLDRRKVDPYDPWVQCEGAFFVNCVGDRTAFRPVAEAWRPPETPTYDKRSARIAVVYLNSASMWRTGERPTRMLELLEEAGKTGPDLVLVSENSARTEDDDVGRAAGKRVSELARQHGMYVVVGGLRTEDSMSVAYVWDRGGELAYQQSIYWTKGFPEVTVFDTDFARIGIHECGDLYTPMIDRTLTLKGAEIILDPSQMWGASGRHNETLLRARALDNGVWVACAHWNTSDAGLRSTVIDPYGQVMASSVFQQEGVLHVDIDFDDKRVYYEGAKAAQGSRGTEGISTYISGDIPEQKAGWRQKMLSRRRPELYGIIPTVNEVTMQYRPEKGPG